MTKEELRVVQEIATALAFARYRMTQKTRKPSNELLKDLKQVDKALESFELLKKEFLS